MVNCIDYYFKTSYFWYLSFNDSLLKEKWTDQTVRPKASCDFVYAMSLSRRGWGGVDPEFNMNRLVHFEVSSWVQYLAFIVLKILIIKPKGTFSTKVHDDDVGDSSSGLA